MTCSDLVERDEQPRDAAAPEGEHDAEKEHGTLTFAPAGADPSTKIVRSTLTR